MHPNPLRAEVAVPEFGTGYHIRLDMDGLAKLEAEFGEFNWLHRLGVGLAVVSVPKMRAICAVGLRDGTGTVVPMPDWPADKPLADLASKCQDALGYAIYGMTFEEQAAQQMKKESAKANPQNGAVLPSQSLDSRLSAPASSPKNSGARRSTMSRNSSAPAESTTTR